MNILINQPAGIGDIIFCQKIYFKLIEAGHQVYWPIKSSISWLTQYLPYLKLPNQLPDIDQVITLDGCHYAIPGSKIMKAKYDLLGISMDNYIDYFNPIRNHEKEEELYKLKVKSSPYRLICNLYGTPSDDGYTAKMNIPSSTEIHNVHICLEPGFTLFDWIKIIENADEIYSTDSSLVLLVEKYKCKANKLVAYSRRKNDSSEVDYLLSKNWEHVC